MSREPNSDCPYCASKDIVRAIFRTPVMPRGMACYQCQTCLSQFMEDKAMARITEDLRAAGLSPGPAEPAP